MTPAVLPDGNQAVALTVAGSDSGGNAGIEADIRAFHSFGVHACVAVSALTAQNPSGVFAVDLPPPEFVARQLQAVLGAYSVGAAKTGMLASADIIRAVARAFVARDAAPPLVVDPVMVATSGAKLIADDAAAALKSDLLPLAAVATPNLPEAEALSGLGRIADEAGMVAAAKAICRSAGCAVLVKGGHRAGAEAQDLLWTPGDGAWWLSSPVVEAPLSTHGTGCSLSAAIAAALALGQKLEDAICSAKAYVLGAIRNAVPVGPVAAVLGFCDPAETASAISRRPA